jgi:hypothetical protein
MIDLVAQEERISQLTGVGFEGLLRALDEETPAALCERYAQIADRYLTLSGKGRRTAEERVELDRLDSALRMLLDEGGLMVLAGRILLVRQVARDGLQALAGRRLHPVVLAQAAVRLREGAAFARAGLRGPLPMPAQELARELEQAAAATEELVALGLGDAAGAARRGLGRLLGNLAARGAGPAAWAAAVELGGARRPAQARTRLAACWTAAGLALCGGALRRLDERLLDIAALVREGIGA